MPKPSDGLIAHRRRIRNRRHRERLGQQLCLAAAVAVVHVAHRRLDVRVAHPGLDRGNLGAADRERAERVAQVVEAERLEAGENEGRLVASSERGGLEEGSATCDEDQILVVDELVAIGQAGERASDVGNPASPDRSRRTPCRSSACRDRRGRPRLYSIRRGRSTSATGLRGSPHTFIARRKMPWRITRYFATLRLDSDSDANAFQRSSRSGVTSSSRRSPRSRTSRSTAWRYSVRVERLTARSCSQYRSHSAAASASVAPVATIPGSSFRLARARMSSNQDCARRLVKWPAGGRPRDVHAGPSFFWTCRPDGNRYLAYQTGPHAPSRLRIAAFPATTRRRNRTFQAGGCPALPVLKTGWATRPLPRRR